FALGALGKRLPLFEARRLRAVALAAALGLGLYYPLVLLQTFNATFHETQGGLFALLQQAPRWTWFLAPALGALLAALIVRAVPESGGHGVVEVIEAVHKRGAPIRGRVALWKSLAAGLVIGSGGSAGREGPVVHLGGAVASSLSRLLALPHGETSILLAAGAGAGIAASFQAPLAGSLFALEIVLADFDVRRFAPVVPACVTAVATSRAMLGGAFGHLAQTALPGIVSSPNAYAAVGMGAVAAGATLAPLTGVLMMFELTGSYQIVLPLLVACGAAAGVVQGLLGGSIYTIGARRRGVRLSRGGPALADLSVAQALDRVESLPADLPYE